MAFTHNRDTFKLFLNELKTNTELTSWFSHMIGEYVLAIDRSIFKNRFICGDLIEEVLEKTFQFIFPAYDCTKIGSTSTRNDLALVPKDVNLPSLYFSSKGSFSGSDIKLINTMSDNTTATFREAMIVVYMRSNKVSLCYIDCEMIDESYIIKKKDSVNLKFKACLASLDASYFENYHHTIDVCLKNIGTKCKTSREVGNFYNNFFHDLDQFANNVKVKKLSETYKNVLKDNNTISPYMNRQHFESIVSKLVSQYPNTIEHMLDNFNNTMKVQFYDKLSLRTKQICTNTNCFLFCKGATYFENNIIKY
jgi:hypothetical protein